MTRHLSTSEAEADRAGVQALSGQVRSPLNAATGVRAPGAAGRRPAGPGRRLDDPVRADMEPRFGHSFAGVRVHADAAAASAAAALGALAFTHGHHIAFAAGQYAPHSAAGRQLLAHELAHVVQQTQPGATPRTMLKPDPKASGPLSVTAAVATEEERRAFAMETVTVLHRHGEHFAALRGPRDPALALSALRTALHSGLQMVDTVPKTEEQARALRTAYAESVHQVLSAFQAAQANTGAQAAPTLQALYQRYSGQIDNTAQVFDADADALSAQLGAPLPKGATAADRSRHKALAQARRALRVGTDAVDIDYAPYFDTNGGTTSMALPPRTTVRLAGGMAPTLHGGLTSVAAHLIDRQLLGPQLTLMLALDLTPYGGGHDAYRFTRIDLGAGNRTRSEVWIERQGAIVGEGLTKRRRAALDARFQRLGFVNENIDATEFDQVLLALDEVPESQLKALSGLAFRRDPASTTEPKAAAAYNPGTHTIRIFDKALSGSQTRLGRQGHVLGFATHAIVHEIGHALDTNGLRLADARASAASQAFMGRYGVGGNRYEGPTRDDPDRPRFDAALADVESAGRARMKARGRSGARWVSVKRAPLTIEDQGPGREPTPAFRAAALKDDGPRGPRVPTTRPKPVPVWQEYYAESFALYQSSPALLKRIRPHVYAHLAAEFPK